MAFTSKDFMDCVEHEIIEHLKGDRACKIPFPVPGDGKLNVLEEGRYRGFFLPAEDQSYIKNFRFVSPYKIIMAPNNLDGDCSLIYGVEHKVRSDTILRSPQEVQNYEERGGVLHLEPHGFISLNRFRGEHDHPVGRGLISAVFDLNSQRLSSVKREELYNHLIEDPENEKIRLKSLDKLQGWDTGIKKGVRGLINMVFSKEGFALANHNYFP
jgi:hypothetical protein